MHFSIPNTKQSAVQEKRNHQLEAKFKNSKITVLQLFPNSPGLYSNEKLKRCVYGPVGQIWDLKSWGLGFNSQLFNQNKSFPTYLARAVSRQPPLQIRWNFNYRQGYSHCQNDQGLTLTGPKTNALTTTKQTEWLESHVQMQGISFCVWVNSTNSKGISTTVTWWGTPQPKSTAWFTIRDEGCWNRSNFSHLKQTLSRSLGS